MRRRRRVTSRPSQPVLHNYLVLLLATRTVGEPLLHFLAGQPLPPAGPSGPSAAAADEGDATIPDDMPLGPPREPNPAVSHRCIAQPRVASVHRAHARALSVAGPRPHAHFDAQHALRVCQQHGRRQACVLLCAA